MIRPGMILIHEIADAPVIMGISKPADLKSQSRGGDIVNPLFVSIDVESPNNAVYLIKSNRNKHSSFSVQNNQGDAKLLSEKIVSVLESQRLERVVIGMEATFIYGDNLVYALSVRTESWAGIPGRSMCPTLSRSISLRNPPLICPRTITWIPM